MKCIYIADDGTQFEDKEECNMYEFYEKIKDCNLVMLDTDLSHIDNIEKFYRCAYVYIGREEDYNKLKDFCDSVGFDYPKGIGSYVYNYNIKEWVTFDEKRLSLEEETRKLKRIKEKLESGCNCDGCKS